MNTTYNTTTATEVTTTATPTQQPEAVATPENNVPSKSRRQLIEEMRREQDGYPVKYWSLLAREIDNKTGGQLWNVPKFGTVIVTEKNIPWYFRYFNDLKTKPARDIEAIETEARKLWTQLEERTKAGRKGFYYEIETFNTAEEYASVIIELYSTKARNGGVIYENISEVEMYDIIGKQIRYAIERFDKTGDRFTSVTTMSIDFRNVASTYNNIKSVYDANHPAPAPTPEPTDTPEEVTTEPNEASEPEQVTATAPTKTRRTKTTSPKPLGRDIYHIFYEKQSRWAIMFDKSVYHDPEGYAVLSDNVILIESKLDYKEEHSGKLIQEDGTESKKDPQLLSKYKEICRPTGDKYATTPKEIEERIKAVQDEEKRTALCDLFDKDMTPEEVKEELKYNKEARAHANAKANPKFVKLLFPTGDYTFLHLKQLKRGLSVAKKLGTNCISKPNNILQFAGEAGRIIVAGCIISPEDESAIAHLTIDLTDATPAPEDTAIEATATAPQATEEDTTTAPEEVATETPVNEPEEVTTEEVATTAPEVVTTAEDDATVFRKAIEECGNLGAKYLESLDYTQATEQVYSTKRGNSTKVTERYYTMKDGTKYGLYRRYNKNGKRAEFAVYQDERIIEKRTYGKNNNTFKAEVKYCGGKLCYQVEEGKITSVEYYEGKRRHYHIEFDDSNRPATPRDLPAPAPSKTTSKETTKEATATTVQEQPTSKQVPTPEATPAPEEVTTVTTSKQDDTTPYWLLLDNELRAQQEEQEQETTPATPEKSEELSKKLSDELATIISKRSNTAPEDKEIPDYSQMTTAEWLEHMRATHDFEFTGCTPYNGRTYYSVAFWRKPVELKGRGVERISDFEYSLTKRAFDKVCEEYTYFSDPNY